MSTSNPDWKDLWDDCVIDHNRLAEVDRVVTKMIQNQRRYEEVQTRTGVPWQLVGAIHYREDSAMRYTTYLHNGDPLGKKTTHVPKGIYFAKNQWNSAAAHAIRYDGLDQIKYTGPISCLVMAEKFNGVGYRKTGIYSPYIWAGTNWSDERGKFGVDHKFNRNQREAQLGVAALLKYLVHLGLGKMVS